MSTPQSSNSPATYRIGFIGGGNMAASLIGGLIQAGHPADHIVVAEPNQERRTWLENEFNVVTTADNALAVQTDAVVLAVKPQVMQTVLTGLADDITDAQPLLISIAAGLTINSLNKWATQGSKEPIAIVRCMPNTPALVGAGASGLFANAHVTPAQQAIADNCLSGSGIVVWVPNETDLDAVTAVSGSGPAYYFAFMEAMQTAGEQLGLSPETARLLTLQTAFGAAKMALESELSPSQLRVNVTSPGGTTEQALQTFATAGLADITANAMQAAKDRAVTLAIELDQD